MKLVTRLGLVACVLSAFGCARKDGEAPSTSTGVFSTGQAASFVTGQSNFTTTTTGTTASVMTYPNAVSISAAGVMYVSDQNNSRVLGFPVPTANGDAATSVLGQSAFNFGATGTSASSLSTPHGVSSSGTQLLVPDWGNHRILIYNTLTTGAAAAVAIGQPNPSSSTDPGVSVSSQTIRYPYGVYAAGGKLVIADSSFNRVLLFNTIPSSNGAAASVALGQANKTSSASGVSTMNSPRAVWTDGTKILVADTNNHRVLGWNSWPSVDGTAPDFILGQSTLATSTPNNGSLSASSLSGPGGVTSNGTEVFVSDSGNNRVLIWNTWPTTNKQAADMVLGQANFVTGTATTTATGLSSPNGLDYQPPRLYVTDTSNNRVLVFIKQ